MASAPATILVLEENAAIQELIEQALGDRGYRVLATMHGREALDVVRRVRVDLLVAGVFVGELRQTLLAELRSIQPGLPIVSICGSDDDLGEDVRGAELSRPFSLDELGVAVAAALDQRGE